MQQRQAETPVVTFSEEVRESVYAGLDRANARQRPSVEQGGMVPAGVTARTGRDQQKVVSTGASALPDASGAGADSDPTPRGRAF